MDSTIAENYSRWNEKAQDDTDIINELNSLCTDEEILDRFYRDLEFGTGGLRGVIGAGTNRMNIYTVGKATQGYAEYLNNTFKNPSVAIAYDSRIKSETFAKRAAGVFAANGIRVYLYRELMPTPALSFAVRHLKCSGGIVITASHNPAQYNGYKVYGCDGCQITTKAAEAIQELINQTNIFADVKYVDFGHALSSGIISYIEEETVCAYLSAVEKESFLSEDIRREFSIVYTPLNGTGLHCVTRALKMNGFTNITVVKEQENPDGNFPTCPFPNPEIKEALALGIQYAEKTGSELVLATDPDCDRVGTAVKAANGYVLLSGNEMGILLFDYICKQRLALGRMPEKPVLVKTIVTTDMAKKVAKHYGVSVIDVLTGFKFIGEQIGILEKSGETDRYILGFEESYGYLSGSFVRDKDGVNASLLICEMFAYYKAQGRNILEVLDSLYEQYGYYLNTLHSYTFEGASGFAHMKEIMANFRNYGIISLANKKVELVDDYMISLSRSNDGTSSEIHLPKSDVLKYHLQDNCSVVIRPSGTEPKLKLYISVNAPYKELARTIETQIVTEVEKYLK